MNLEVLNLLYSEGFINGFSISETKPHNICVFLKYLDEKPVLQRFRIISTSSKRVYVSYETIVKQLVNNGLFVVSTNKYGLTLTDDYLRHSDVLMRIGGELLFQIIF
jgi:ribosomal protein S8